MLLAARLMIPTCKIIPERANLASRVALRHTCERPRETPCGERPGKLTQSFQSEINN